MGKIKIPNAFNKTKQQQRQELIQKTQNEIAKQKSQEVLLNKEKENNNIIYKNSSKSYNNKPQEILYDIQLLNKIESKFPMFKEELFSFVDLVNFYFNSIIREFLLKKTKTKDKKTEQKRLQQFKESVDKIDSEAQKEKNYNKQTKKTFEDLFKIETIDNFDYLSKYFVRVFKDFLSQENYLYEFKRETKENFLIFYEMNLDLNKTIEDKQYNNNDDKQKYKTIKENLKKEINSFFRDKNIIINSINAIVEKRHKLEHSENIANDLHFLLSMMLYLPADEMEKLLSKIGGYVDRLRNNKQQEETIDEQMEYDIIRNFYNSCFKKTYKQQIDEFYSEGVVKTNTKFNNKKEQKQNREARKRRKLILQGMITFKNKETNKKEEKPDIWRQYFNRYQDNYNKTFINSKNTNKNSGDFFKLPTFKRIFNFYSRANIKRIEDYFIEIVNKSIKSEHNRNNEKYDFLRDKTDEEFKKLIKFDYVREFYDFCFDISVLIRKFLFGILVYENKEDFKQDNTKDNDLRKLRNNLKHNHLFFYGDKNFLNIRQTVLAPVFERLKQIEQEIQQNIRQEVKQLKQTIINSNKNLDKQQLNDKITEEINSQIKSIQEQFSNGFSYCPYENFKKSLTDLIKKLMSPYYYNQDRNNLKTFNSVKLKRYKQDKNNYTVDNKIILQLVGKEMLLNCKD